MAEQLYNIIISGKPLPGHQVGEMKKNLAATFKLSLDKIERWFTGKPVIIKKGVDLETARKFQSALERAGAECKILPLSGEPDKKPTAASAKEVSVKAEEHAQEPPVKAQQFDVSKPVQPKIISTSPKPVTLQYTPLPCSTLTAAEDGLNFNRYGSERVLFSDILLLSVFNIPSGAKFKTKFLVFTKKQKKPLILESNTIRYEDFPGTKDADEYTSLRNFINMVFSKNHAINIDESTNTFLAGNSPVIFRKDEAALSSALGTALDSDNLFELAVTTGKQAGTKPTLTTLQASDEPVSKSKTPVIIGVVAIVLIAVIGITGGIISSKLKKKQQQRYKEALEMPLMPNMPNMPSGFPAMPQNPEEAMQMAYDNMAMAELKNTCMRAQMHFSEDPFTPLSLEVLKERYGFRPPPEVTIQLIDPSIDNLRISARHANGSKTFYVDAECRIE